MEIGIGKTIDKIELKKHLCNLFKTKAVYISDNIEDIKKDQAYFVLTTDTDYEGFPLGIGFYKFLWKEEEYIDMLHRIAESIGIEFNCKCFTEAVKYAPTRSPYWLLLYDKDGWYLATEDCNNEEQYQISKVKFIAKKLDV